MYTNFLKMKIPLKIVLLNVLLALLFSFLITALIKNSFIEIFALVTAFGGFADSIAGLILLKKKNTLYAQGFLLSGGLLMLIGFAVCSTAF